MAIVATPRTVVPGDPSANRRDILHSVQEPELAAAGSRVLPNNVREAIAVEIARYCFYLQVREIERGVQRAPRRSHYKAARDAVSRKGRCGRHSL
jgi:hypothetical protein